MLYLHEVEVFAQDSKPEDKPLRVVTVQAWGDSQAFRKARAECPEVPFASLRIARSWVES